VNATGKRIVAAELRKIETRLVAEKQAIDAVCHTHATDLAVAIHHVRIAEGALTRSADSPPCGAQACGQLSLFAI